MTKRKGMKPVFKLYAMDQMLLMPRSYEEMIPEDHLVRVVNRAVEQIKLEGLLQQYVGGGTSSYHPKMMLKVLVYAYCQKIYTSRKIGAALRENIYFMWLSGGHTPDFRTINEFRGVRMKAVIGEVFGAVVDYLVEAGYVRLENLFVDGSKIEADANKHKVVWVKRKERYEKRVKEQIQELLQEIENANDAEQAEYGEKDLEEMGGSGTPDLDGERLQKKIDELNQWLREKERKPEQEKKARQALKKLESDCLPRLQKYEEQTRILGGRNSYSKTDPDASCQRMKEDRGAKRPWAKPAYNVQLGTEGQFIVSTSVHPGGSDTPCLIPHLNGMSAKLKSQLKNVVADAAYGSEENYDYLKRHRLGNYLKYNTFYQDTHHYRNPDILRQHQFRSEHFEYDEPNDQFLCPNKRRLSYRFTSQSKTDNGYLSTRRHYECETCTDCPLKSQCTKAKGNRLIQVSFQLRELRRQARQNLTSEQGQQLRAQRSVEVETVFGHLKHNLGFRRFHLRGQDKVTTEWTLLCIAHNMQKLAV
jgi:transposase